MSQTGRKGAKMEVNKNENKFYRFQIYQGEKDNKGIVRKSKSVGMAYLKEGQPMLTMKLWTFVNEKFYLILNQNDASRYLVMTREPNKNPVGKNKYFWNIVGNGIIDTIAGTVTLHFDLFDKPIYMSTHPESSAYSVSMSKPEDITVDAA